MSAATEGADYCYFTIDVPEGQMALKVEELTGTDAERRLYVNADSPPSVSGWGEASDCSRKGSGRLTCDIANPTPGTWWIGVGNYEYRHSTSTDPFTITATYSAGTNCGDQSAPVSVSNGVELSAATAGSAYCYFTIDVPEGQMALKVEELTGTDAERRLYVNADSPPSVSGWGEASDCSRKGSGRLTCDIANPTPGTWWIGVGNYEYRHSTSTDPFTLKATHVQPVNCGASTETPHGLTSATPEQVIPRRPTLCYYTIEVPEGQSSLYVEQASPSGADRTVHVNHGPLRLGEAATGCTGSSPTGTSSCLVQMPQTGTWWIAVTDTKSQRTEPFTIKATYHVAPQSAAVGAGPVGSQSGDSTVQGPADAQSSTSNSSGWFSKAMMSLGVSAVAVVGTVGTGAVVVKTVRKKRESRQRAFEQWKRENPAYEPLWMSREKHKAAWTAQDEAMARDADAARAANAAREEAIARGEARQARKAAEYRAEEDAERARQEAAAANRNARRAQETTHSAAGQRTSHDAAQRTHQAGGDHRSKTRTAERGTYSDDVRQAMRRVGVQEGQTWEGMFATYTKRKQVLDKAARQAGDNKAVKDAAVSERLQLDKDYRVLKQHFADD